ncbi:MAG: 23S rRNA (pseudouridine(1915)-N(3))-methyltransferase RlmH [Candidatus Gracilibacteria bacterium]|nr:23S rRNA (pseudouridine(1915)-N(3))-methyltransferase RlmH [Candidatus Gracilibacteria bacterium]
MKIRLLMFGKNKDSYTEQMVKDFEKKIRPFCELDLQYLKDEKVHDDVEKILKKESERLFNKLENRDYLIILDDKGQSLSSITFSQKFQNIIDSGPSSIVFVIGSAHGLSMEVKERADLLLSLSTLTMTHQIVRLVLLEQIYRAFTILRGMKYHK